MSTFAVVENGVVVNIEVVEDLDWLDEQSNRENYFETTIDNPACIGYIYDNGFFVEPSPYSDWVKLNTKTLLTSMANTPQWWGPPTPYPTDQLTPKYDWDEINHCWVVNQSN